MKHPSFALTVASIVTLSICVTALSLGLPLTVSAQQNAESDQRTVDRIIGEINLDHRLNRTPEEMKSQLESNPFGLQTEEHGRLLKRFSEAFHPDTLMSLARNQFQRSTQPTQVSSVMEWLSREPAEKVHGAEEEFYTTQGTRKRIIRMYEMEQDTVSQERQVLMADLVNITSAADSRVHAYTTIFRAFLSAFSSVSEQQSFTEQQIDQFVSDYRANIYQDIRRELVDRYLLIYYDLGSDTLQQFISFYRTEPGTWLNDTIIASLEYAYETASDRFVESMTEKN